MPDLNLRMCVESPIDAIVRNDPRRRMFSSVDVVSGDPGICGQLSM